LTFLHVANRPPIEGRDSIFRFYRTMFGFLTSSETEVQAISISETGDMAYNIGRTVNAFDGPYGTVKYGWTYLLIWELV